MSNPNVDDPSQFGDLARYSAFVYDKERAFRYGQRVRKIIPGYEAMHELAVARMSSVYGEQPIRVLVVGAGSGAEVITIAHGVQKGLLGSGTEIIAVEPSKEMHRSGRAAIRTALKGVSDSGKGLHLHWRSEFLADTLEGVQRGDLTGGFDVATVLLTLHFLPRPAKVALLHEVRQLVRPGGLVLVADIAPETGGNDLVERGEYSEWMLSDWVRRLVLLGASPAAAAESGRHVREDMPWLSAAMEVALLEEVGFTGVTPFFRSLSVHGWWMKNPS